MTLFEIIKISDQRRVAIVYFMQSYKSQFAVGSEHTIHNSHLIQNEDEAESHPSKYHLTCSILTNRWWKSALHFFSKLNMD